MLPAMLAAAWLSGLAAVQPYAQITETTASPLRKIIDCRGAGSGAAACGPAVPIRTTWTNFCGLEAIQNKTRLAGIVLDVVLIPSEDETLFLLDAAGKTYLGGIVGEVLTQIATEGMFEFNAIVVDPPTFDEYHDGKIHEDDGDEDEYHDWTAWAMDWTNRAGITYMALLTTYNGTTYYGTTYYGTTALLTMTLLTMALLAMALLTKALWHYSLLTMALLATYYGRLGRRLVPRQSR